MTIDLNADFAALAAKLRGSTVRVHDERRRGSGSGIVWDPSGVVMTNAHVARGRYATVEWEGGHERAEIVRRDEGRDLAAIRVTAATLPPPAAIRDSSDLVPGEMAVAVGNPLGLVGALSTGLVQRCNARWVIADVRLAPGNSGGPLADAAGRVVGINSMVAGGLALAVPSRAVAAFLRAAPRRLGVTLAATALTAGRERVPALLVTGIESGSVAERAGLRLGDAILGTERGRARDPQTLAASLSGAATLELARGGRLATLALSWPAEDARAA